MAEPKQVSTQRFKQRQKQLSRCWYRRALEQLSADHMAELDAALADLEITSKTISDVLAEEFDFVIASRTISAHRNRECRCE